MTAEEREQLKAELLVELAQQRKEPTISVASEAMHKYENRIHSLATKSPNDLIPALYTLLRCSYGVRHISKIPCTEKDAVFGIVSAVLALVERIRFREEAENARR